MIDISMGIITPLSEQLNKPLPNAIVLVTLEELSTFARRPHLVVSARGDESTEELEILKSIDAMMVLRNDLNLPVIHHIEFPKGIHMDNLVIAAGNNAGALLVDGFGEGLLLEAPEQYFDFLRNTYFNLLQGCRMRNTKTQESSVSCVTLSSIIKILTNLVTSLKEMHTKEYSCEGTLLEGVLFVLFLKDLCMSNLLLFTFIFNLLWRSKLNGRGRAVGWREIEREDGSMEDSTATVVDLGDRCGGGKEEVETFEEFYTM
ncbi:hypothetical protein LguiA_030379 [Lonicera macranthoides]